MGIYDREEAVERSRRWLRIGSVILIASGTASIVVPPLARLSISFALGLAILVAGLAHGILAFSVQKPGTSLRLALVSATFFVVAMTLLAKRNIAVATMAWLIAASLLIEAAVEIVYFAVARPGSGSKWALVNAILTIWLAVLICSGWPRGSAWALEIVVGITLIASGLTWIPRSRPSSFYSLK